MDLGAYLLLTRQLKIDEFNQLIAMQAGNVVDNLKPVNGIPTRTLNDALQQLEEVRFQPFGELLQTAIDNDIVDDVFSRESLNLGALVDDWQEWHVQSLEPISTYSLSNKIGRQIYEQQLEKKLVGEYVATKLAHDHDVVILPEGSSGLYVGLALAKRRQHIAIRTSNDPLVREYRDNPALRRLLDAVDVIGGSVDAEHGGIFGPACLKQFESAIKEHEPSATIVVMPVSQLLPKEGPFAADGPAKATKQKIIECSLAAGVRALIFVADYTKHLGGPSQEYAAIYNRPDQWRSMVERHASLLHIITSPPPVLRKSIEDGSVEKVLQRDGASLQIQMKNRWSEVKEYDAIAREFGGLLIGKGAFQTNFVEAVGPLSADIRAPKPTAKIPATALKK